MNWGEIMTELKVTQFNTIKGDYFTELSADKFIKRISKNINKHCEYYYDDELQPNAYYKSYVYETEKDNVYEVSFLDEYGVYKSYDKYQIDLSNHPSLKECFDKFSEISYMHSYEKECYKKVENNEPTTTEENAAFLNYVSGARKHCNNYILKMLALMLGVPLSIIALIICFAFIQLFLAEIFSFALLFLSTYKFCFCIIDGKYSNFLGRIKTSRLLKKKMKQIKSKLNMKKIENTELVITTDKNAVYRDNIINYMNNIRNSANMLNNGDRINILNELKDILDEYTDKCQKINSEEQRGLTLNNGKKQVMMDTINKLTALDMKLADMLNRESKNSSMIAENEKFMAELNEDINGLNDVAVMTSGGKVLSRKK